MYLILFYVNIIVEDYFVNYKIMTETTKTIPKVNYIESKKKNLLWPILFLVFIIIISIWAFAYNYIINVYWFHILWFNYDSKEQLKKQIDDNNKSINELNSKPEIEVYKLLEAEKKNIKELEKRSEISTYIKHLKSLSEPKYWIHFQWFSLANWVITTTVVIESSLQDRKIPYEKARDFIKNYRTDTWALLDLVFINVIEWMDSMKFDTNFKVK